LHLALTVLQPEQALALLELMLAHQADIQRTGPNIVVNGQSPCSALFTALYAFHFQHKDADSYLPVIARLLQAGARVDAMDQGKAALHWAALWGHEALVRLLLQHGADRFQVGASEMLPATYARMRKAKAVEALLAPEAGMLWRTRVHELGASVLQGVTLVLFVFAVMGLGYEKFGPRAREANASFPLLYAQYMLAWLALRATFIGSWSGLLARLRQDVRTLKGWAVWLAGPFLVAGVPAGLTRNR
jgi:hypothetical protein